jgi:hypothetical protein
VPASRRAIQEHVHRCVDGTLPRLPDIMMGCAAPSPVSCGGLRVRAVPCPSEPPCIGCTSGVFVRGVLASVRSSYYQRQAMPRWQQEAEDATYRMQDATAAEAEVRLRLGTAYEASTARVVLARGSPPRGTASRDGTPSKARRRDPRLSYQHSASHQRGHQAEASARLASGFRCASRLTPPDSMFLRRRARRADGLGAPRPRTPCPSKSHDLRPAIVCNHLLACLPAAAPPPRPIRSTLIHLPDSHCFSTRTETQCCATSVFQR